MEIKEISRKEYDDFLEKVESYSFLQTSKMSEVLISNNRQTKLLALVDKGEVLALFDFLPTTTRLSLTTYFA